MSISSLVIDLAPDAEGAAARARLAADARITLGPAQGTRQALVLETSGQGEDIAAFDELRDLPGVRLVTLVRAYLDDAALPAGAAATYL